MVILNNNKNNLNKIRIFDFRGPLNVHSDNLEYSKYSVRWLLNKYINYKILNRKKLLQVPIKPIYLSNGTTVIILGTNMVLRW